MGKTGTVYAIENLGLVVVIIDMFTQESSHVAGSSHFPQLYTTDVMTIFQVGYGGARLLVNCP